MYFIYFFIVNTPKISFLWSVNWRNTLTSFSLPSLTLSHSLSFSLTLSLSSIYSLLNLIVSLFLLHKHSHTHTATHTHTRTHFFYSFYSDSFSLSQLTILTGTIFLVTLRWEKVLRSSRQGDFAPTFHAILMLMIKV